MRHTYTETSDYEHSAIGIMVLRCEELVASWTAATWALYRTALLVLHFGRALYLIN